MRELLLPLCAFLIVASYPSAVASGPLPDEPDGWSWQDGLLGDGSRRDDVFAEGEFFPGYLCDECRDPQEHPMDFVAVAYNGFFGEDPWMLGSQLGVPFRIYNLQMQWVVIWFEGIAFDSITLLPDTLNFRVRLANGQILTFTVLQGGPDLPVGEPNPAPPAVDGCTCDGDDDDPDDDGNGDDEYGDGNDDYAEPVDGLPEPSGVVSIVDPDDDGGFPEWDL